MAPKSNFIDELSWRGLIQDLSDEAEIRKLPVGTPFYFGVDPTAPSLHLGNLSSMMTAFHLARCGLKPIMLFGGSTGSIGDPKATSERQLLSREQIQSNVAAQTAQVKAIFARCGVEATYVDNFDWTASVSVLDFLRDTGKYFTVNYMLSKEVVKTRLDGEGISYTEFSYMLLQAFDYLHLYNKFGCRLQIGGSDQWGNITAGLELIRRKIHGSAFALSSPLMVDSEGRKMGKSEGGALWLDAKMLSPFKMHQFLLNIPDAEAVKLLKRFSFLTEEEISAIDTAHRAAPEKREAQRRLADTVVGMLHGEDAVSMANRSAQVLFGGALEGFSDTELLDIFSSVPSQQISEEALATASCLDLFVSAGLAKSKGEAKRLVENGGAYINGARITEIGMLANALPQTGSKLLVLRSGKKNYALLKRGV